MDLIMETLLEITVFSVVITAVILLLRRLFRRSISPRLQYAIWALLILRLMLPVTLESGLHIGSLFPAAAPAQTQVFEAAAEAAPAEQRATAAPQDTAAVFSNAPAAHPAGEYHSPAAFPWPSVAVGAWIFGACAVFFVTLTAKRRFVKRVSNAQCAKNAALNELFLSLAEELKIKRPPRLIVTSMSISPALMPIRGRLTVIMPEALLSDAAACRYALLHELMHLKRCDHAVCLLLAALRCVYWFDPVVWPGFNELQSDMETACDADVLARISPDEKRGYLLTVLGLFRRCAALEPGMARYTTRRLARRRIAGAFLRGRSGGAARAAAAAAAAVLLLCCFTTACRPAPERTVVIDAANSVPSTSGDRAALGAPERWSETVSAGVSGVVISADAPITGTDLSAYPVVELRAAEFSDEQFKSIVNYFADGRKLFDASRETRADVERLLAEAKRGTEIDGAFIPPEPDDPHILSLEQKLASMPADSRRYIEPKLSPQEGGLMAMYAGIELGAGEDASLSVVAHGTRRLTSQVFYHHGGLLWDEYLAALNDITLAAPSDITPEEAVRAARRVMGELGIEGLELSSVSPGAINGAPDAGEVRTAYASEGYIVVFTRSACGMPATDISRGRGYSAYSNSLSTQSAPEYVAPWLPERLEIYVDKNGMQHMLYENRCTQGAVIKKDSGLLSFEQIKKSAQKRLFDRFSGTGEDIVINIRRIELGGAVINGSEPGEGLFVSTWHMFYDVTRTNDAGSMTGDDGVLMINAADGGIIENALYSKGL